jgi:hypothetical protein
MKLSYKLIIVVFCVVVLATHAWGIDLFGDLVVLGFTACAVFSKEGL